MKAYERSLSQRERERDSAIFVLHRCVSIMVSSLTKFACGVLSKKEFELADDYT